MNLQDYFAEPYKIKMVEPIRLTTEEERTKLIAEAGYNLFLLKSDDVYIDLLTDSGTGAMSDNQWAGIMLGDEAYAGSRSFFHLQETIREITGFDYLMPTHQGRAAENIFFATIIKKAGDYVVGNYHFDTTTAHIEFKKGAAVNIPLDITKDTGAYHPFKGNVDLEKMRSFIQEKGPEKIAVILMTLTCNSSGGQPVSMENLRGAREISQEFNIPLYIDGARFAENAYFIKQRETGYQDKSIKEICQEMFSYADGMTMSAKKDGLVNIGGFFATREKKVYEEVAQLGILFEGFLTYGGMAGRDMEALARGLKEVLAESYLSSRIGQVEYLGKQLIEAGIPILQPIGGHAVFIDAKKFLPHLPQEQFPGQALCIELYKEAGVRGVEIGTLLAGRDPSTGQNKMPDLDLVRLTIPRRTYTNNHMDVVAAGVKAVWERRQSVNGYQFTYEPPRLRHFSCLLKPID